MTLTSRIVIAMTLGIFLGSLLKLTHDLSILGPSLDYFLLDIVANGFFDILGQIFIASLRLLIVPLVFFSLVCGVVSISSTSQIGRITIKTLGLYLLTTAIAISLALSFAVLIQPGVGIDMSIPQAFEPNQAPGLKEVIIGIFPTNPIAAMSEGNMLQIIIFSLLFGVALKSSGGFT